jgi:hypothetical protein
MGGLLTPFQVGISAAIAELASIAKKAAAQAVLISLG